MLDHYGKGWLTASELIISLKDNFNINDLKREDIYLFFRRYDGDSDGKLSFSDFCTAFTPLSKEYATLLTSRPDFYSKKASRYSDYFSAETRDEFKRVWATNFTTERASECLRVRISKRLNFSLKEAFYMCDLNGNGIIGVEEFRNVLGEHGFYATERELNSLIEKFDKDKDSKVSFAEFVEELTPKLN